MHTVKAYIRAMRPRHYVKNLLVFVPLFFSGRFLEASLLLPLLLVFCLFSLFCSCIYIWNDIVDYPYDIHHPVKRRRPIASGDISRRNAGVFAAALAALCLAGLFWVQPACALLTVLYGALNVCYSLWLKKIPLLDVFCIATGFVLRIYVGGAAVGVVVSHWLLLTILCISLYLAFGKRRNEMIHTEPGAETRKVLQSYNFEFLDKSMFSMMTLTIAFYALWALDTQETRLGGQRNLVLTVPVVILGMLRYMSLVEASGHGDPTDVILQDRFLLIVGAVYVGMMGIFFYL